MSVTSQKLKLNDFLIYITIFVSLFSYEYTLYRSNYRLMILAVFIIGFTIFFLNLFHKQHFINYKKILKDNSLVHLLSISILISTLITTFKHGLITYNGLISVCLTIFSIYIFYLFIPILVLKNLDALINKIFYIITILSVISIIIVIRGSFLGYTPQYNRISSILFDPNYFGTLSAIGFIIGVHIKKYRYLSILNFISLYYSGSRAAMLGLIIVIITLFFYAKKIRLSTLLMFLIICIITFGFIVYLYSIDFFRVYQGLNSREILWDLSFLLIRSEPWWGYGYGVVSQLIESFGLMNSSSHNAFLDYILTYGIISFMLNALVILKAIYIGIKNKVSTHIIKSVIFLLIVSNSITITVGGLGATSLLFTLFLGICNLSGYKDEIMSPSTRTLREHSI